MGMESQRHSTFPVNGLKKSGKIGGVAGSADNDVIANHERRHAAECFQRGIVNLNLPDHFSVAGVEAEKLRIESGQKEAILPHGETLVASADGLPGTREVPDLPAGASVHRPRLIATRDVEDAVHFEGHGLQTLRVRLKRPGETHRANICFIDLREGAEAAAGVVAIVRGPAIRGRRQDLSRVQVLTVQMRRR